MTDGHRRAPLGVAEAKRRFSELVDRVARGERFLVMRRGRPAVALVPPAESSVAPEPEPTGLAAVAGALEDWPELEQDVKRMVGLRRKARDRRVPDLD